VISHYFDHHPSVRRSFLEAVQRVAGCGSLSTPVATPAHAVDNELAASAPREVANRTGSIIHDEVEGAHGRATTVTNELHIDIEDPPGLGIQRLQWNNPEDTVPFGSLNLGEADEPFPCSYSAID